MAMVLKEGEMKVNWLSTTLLSHSLDIYQTQFIRDEGEETAVRWPEAATVIEETARIYGTLSRPHKQHWIITTEEPMTPALALRICEHIQNIWDAKGIEFVRFDLDKLAKAAKPKAVLPFVHPVADDVVEDEYKPSPMVFEDEGPVGPDSFGGEDGMPAPSVKRIREELEAECMAHDMSMSGLLGRHRVAITEKEREALVEDAGPTLREAKGVLDDIRAMKKRVGGNVPGLKKITAASTPAAVLLDRSSWHGLKPEKLVSEVLWKIEGMAASKRLDIEALIKELVRQEAAK